MCAFSPILVLALAVDDGLVYRACGGGQHLLGLAVAMFFNREFRLRKTAVRW